MDRPERQSGFWRRGAFRLLRNRTYDNAQAKRVWFPPASTGRGVWTWAIAVSDIAEFREMHHDAALQRLHPRRDARAWAARWNELDAYICGYRREPPTYEEFDPLHHCIAMTTRPMFCWCGCGASEGSTRYCETPWAIFVEGPMSRKWNLRVRPH